jgi:uncharacterized protein HemX
LVKDLAASAVVPQVVRPANPRPIQPVKASEAIIALAVILAVAMLVGLGFMLGRIQQRRVDRRHARRLNQRSEGRQPSGHRRNLRLVTPKRR